jgi:ornithine cyclodeaminase/alanine dehydrogenase-like protein (mu-crystallin family)
MTAILYSDAAEVRRRLRMADLIPAMERALADFSAGRVVQPVRQVIPTAQGFLGLMPAVAGLMGVKLVTFYPGNRGIPTHHAIVVLFRAQTGEPIAVLDGTVITEMRTAAVSAAATKLLAAPDARVLAILGAGVQAKSHLEALPLVRRFEDVRVWSPSGRGLPGARTMPDAESAVRGADVVCTVTSATQPVLRGAWLKPGAHVNAVGACRPDWRELDDDAMRGVVYVDSREAALRESGDVILSKAAIHAELGEALGRAPERGRHTVFKSLGLAIEDVAAAGMVLESVIPDRSPPTPE